MTMGGRVTYVGHSTVLIELDGVRLLTDPVLRARVGPLRRQAPPPEPGVTSGLDAVLVSHLHRDHADLPSLRALGGRAPLIAAAGAGEFLRRRGFSVASELAPGESRQVGEVTVTATQASHSGRRRGAPDAQSVGFLVSGSRKVYFAGDTDLFEGMEELGQNDLDLALLPVWGWGPTLGPGHLDPERAARAAALLSPKVAIPIHWGTLYPAGLSRLRPRPLRLPAAEFATEMESLAPQVEARVLRPGESTSLS